MEKKEYNKVYDFTNENVNCLNKLYNFENSKVLTVIGSGDQYFSSILNGAKEVDVFDKNPTSYLYFVLKFYAIRELTYEEFYDFLVRKNVKNSKVYFKLEPYLPKEVLKYYHFLISQNRYLKKRRECFRKDNINLLKKCNQKYYFNNSNSIIPYFLKDNYYKLQDKLKNMNLPNFFETDFLNLNYKMNSKYDVLLTSNIFEYLQVDAFEYVEILKQFDIPEIQVCYDWFGFYIDTFMQLGCSTNGVAPSSHNEFYEKVNYVYSLKK